MTVADIERFFDHWAPPWTARERDNVGVQVGDRSRTVNRILLTLDVTPETIREAVRRKADLIISHHPLLFRPLSSVTTSDVAGSLVLTLAEKRITLFSAHTNLDFARDGVSFSLAQALGLEDIRFLAPLKGSLVKLAVFVPEGHVEAVAEALARAGAGIIGNYSACSFRLKGTGTFRGSYETKPFVGRAQQLETVDEIRLETLVPRVALGGVISAMKAAHPYEEVAYDVYTLENTSPNFGMGAFGRLARPMSLRSFLAMLKERLKAKVVRYVGEPAQQIRQVAVCGGSGSDLLHDALGAKADVFVTADVRYHVFHDAQGRIALVDAGHWETEHVMLPVVQRRLRELTRRAGAATQIFIAEKSSNPIECL